MAPAAHANRDHRALIEAATTGTGRASLERLLFDLYRRDRAGSEIFEDLSAATGAKGTRDSQLKSTLQRQSRIMRKINEQNERIKRA